MCRVGASARGRPQPPRPALPVTCRVYQHLRRDASV
jgi:hypothetical protein